MVNTLVSAPELVDFPGAPHDDYLVDLAAAAVRAEAGWHIAPVLTETLTVDSYGGTLLVLPTRRIVAVTAVRDVTDGSELLTGWKRWAGGLYRTTSGWPVGRIEVDLSHGYATTPLELLPILAARSMSLVNVRNPDLAARSVGGVSESYRDVSVADPVIQRYSVPAGVA